MAANLVHTSIFHPLQKQTRATIDILHLKPHAFSMIVLVDYQAGNLGSVRNMFKKVGAAITVSTDPRVLEQADKIILPGIGRFDHCMQALEKSNLIPILEKKVLTEKTPCLGICVGFQLMARHGEEGNCNGLNWIDADVKKFKFLPSQNLKVPHMGWNFVKPLKESPLVQNFGEEPRFYFAHSYYFDCADKSVCLLETEYGLPFTSAVQKENIMGVQFHPEKSHKYGMALLRNFAEISR
jgi:glutamine amidotransferase